MLAEMKIDGVPLFVDSTIQITLLAFHLDIGFIHTPTAIHTFFASLDLFCDQRNESLNPALNRSVINLNAAFFYEFFNVSVA